jgi:hypothetical protein
MEMKSVQEVMNEKSYFKCQNERFVVSGNIHLVAIGNSSIYNEVESVLTDVEIYDSVTTSTIQFYDFPHWEFIEAIRGFRNHAIDKKCEEWEIAVRHERQYNLANGYMEAFENVFGGVK